MGEKRGRPPTIPGRKKTNSKKRRKDYISGKKNYDALESSLYGGPNRRCSIPKKGGDKQRKILL